MKVVGFAGYSGAGKTTLVERVIPALKARGLRVSVIKHAHHRFDIDQPGKDSWRHREAGAFEVLVASDRRMALMREYEREQEPQVHHLLAELSPVVDWVLVEGFRHSDLPKIEVWRAENAQDEGRSVQQSVRHSVHYPDDPYVTALAVDDVSRLPVPTGLDVLDINAPEAVAAWLVAHGQRFEYQPESYSG